MEWLKNLFHSRDRATSESACGTASTQTKKQPVQPLLTATVPGSTRHKDQGLDWYRAGLRHDEDGDEAHAFIVCDDETR